MDLHIWKMAINNLMKFKQPQQKESVSKFDSRNDPMLRVLDILETLQRKFKHRINKNTGVLTLWNIW